MDAVNRRRFLGATGAAAVAALAGCEGESGTERTLPGRTVPHPPSREEDTIFDLEFRIETRYRPFELIDPAFVAVDELGPSDVTDRALAEATPAAPFAAVELDVLADTDGVVVAGLASPADEHVLGFHDRTARQAGIEIRRAGQTTIVATSAADLPAGYRLATAVCENQVTVLADVGDGWQPLVTARDEVAALVDLRAQTTLGGLRYAWGAQPGTGSVRHGRARAGLFGMAGVRDLHLVQDADGSPYVRDGKAYLTATCAGLGFFQQAHWGVFTLDLADPTRIDQVAHLYAHRDGLVLGDHAGQIVRDEERGRWIVTMSSWGDFADDGVHIRHVETTEDVLHGVHILDTQPTALPTSQSSWDPGLTRIDRRWHLSFVESPSQDPFVFHPTLARGPAGALWNEGLELVGAADRLEQCEGPLLTRVGGDWWLLASDGEGRRYPVFDLRMRDVGRLAAPYKSNIPHPQLVPFDDGGYLLVTFDGTAFHKDVLGYGTHGDLLVMRSATADH